MCVTCVSRARQPTNCRLTTLQFIDALVSTSAAAAAAADVVTLPLARKDTAILSQIHWMCRERSPPPHPSSLLHTHPLTPPLPPHPPPPVAHVSIPSPVQRFRRRCNGRLLRCECVMRGGVSHIVTRNMSRITHHTSHITHHGSLTARRCVALQAATRVTCDM